MNNKEKIKKLIEENNHLKIAGIIIIVCLLIVAIGLTFKLNNENKNVCYDMKTLNESINKIQENCGSTQITHGFNDESNWYVFKTTYEGNKPNYNYYKLEDCIAKKQ